MNASSFVSRLTWQDWVTLGSFAFGIVTLLAFLDQRRSTRRTAALLKWAALNLDKSISEEQIKGLSAQKAAMEQEITEKIPALARSAVLREEAQIHERAVAEHFTALQRIERELGSESFRSALDPQVQQAILDFIVPHYIRLDRRDRLRNRVIVLSVGMATSSAVMPFPLSSMFAVVVALALLYTGALLYSVNEDSARAFRILRPCFHFAYLAAAIAFTILGVMVIGYSDQPSIRNLLAKILIGVGISLIAAYLVLRRWIDTFVTKLCKSEPRMRERKLQDGI